MAEEDDIVESLMISTWTTKSTMVFDDQHIDSMQLTATLWLNDSTLYDPGSTDDPLMGFLYPSFYSITHITVSSLIVTIIMLIIVAGNVLVIVAIAVDRSLKGPQNWFIASLAVSDLLVGLFIMPLSLANELMGYWPFGDILCQLWLSTDVLLCTASILNLVLISLDRYWSITKAISYVRVRTKRRAVAMIAIVWLLSMVICFPPLVGWKRPQPMRFGFPLCILSEEPGYIVYSTVGSFYLPLIVMVVVYFKIYMVARSHARRHRKKYSNGLSKCSMADTTMNNVSRRNCMEEFSRVSQMPEISSDMSNSVQTQDPEPGQSSNSAENCPQTSDGDVVQLGGGSERTVPKQTTGTRDTDTTDSQSDTPTRFLLPNAKRTNLPAVSELDDSPETKTSVRSSRSRRARSLPGNNPAGKVLTIEDCITTTSGFPTIARHSWQTRSHRDPASHRGRDPGDRQQNPGIPTIKIFSDSKDLECLESKSRSDLLFNLRSKAYFPHSRPSQPSSDPREAVDTQQRQRRRLARMKERRATFVLGIVMASFVGCWLPFFSLYPISSLAKIDVPPAVFAFIFWLGYINSALNPIIYTIFNREFRLAFKRLLCGRRKV